MLRPPVNTLIKKYPIPKPPHRPYVTEATLPTKPYLLHKLDQGPSAQTTLKKTDALLLYKQMTTIRKMETSIGNLYKAKIVRGFCHLYIGQEAVAVGIHFNLHPGKDSVITSYRNHAWAYLSHKLTISDIIAEVTGGQNGCARGKGGSMHLYGSNFYAGSSIVGAQVPMGVGIALGYKYTNSDAISVTIYGDGAANNGQVFEVFNMAKMWTLPCLFLCENNMYGMGTSIHRATADINFYQKGGVIPGICVDGMDVLSVIEAVKFARAYCSTGKGPLILEAQTYRYSGHSLSDPGTSYRTRDEVTEVRKTRDPISNLKKKILEAGLVTEEELKEIDKEAKRIVDDATSRAKGDKEPGVEELTYDIYANEVVKEVRGVTPFKKWVHKNTNRFPLKK